MRLGLQVPDLTWPNGPDELGDTFGLIAQRAERAGLYSFWMMDHFFQPGIGPMEHEMLEGWSALSFAAGRTNRIKLGTMVTGVMYRFPAVLVKTCTTLDVLSHGRTYFGIGAGWFEQEHQALGVPFPPVAERFERLEEALQIALQLWSGEDKPYEGKHYHLARTLHVPQPVQRPHPPILIGGDGERKTLRLVAQDADACNLHAQLGDTQHEMLRHKLDVLREHCQALGRPYEAIEKTTISTLPADGLHLTRDGRDGSMTPDAAVEAFARLAALGIDHAIFNMPNVTDIEVFDLLRDEVVPRVERIQVAGR